MGQFLIAGDKVRVLLSSAVGITTARHRFGPLSRFLDWCQDACRSCPATSEDGVESKLTWPVYVTHDVAARCWFVRRRSGVFDGHFLVGLSGPFPGADLPCAWAPRTGAVKSLPRTRSGDGLALGEATASRREASLTAPSTAPG